MDTIIATAAALAVLHYGPATPDGTALNFAAHAAVGAGVGGYIGYKARDPVLGFMAGAAVGVAKELSDKHFDKRDAAWTAAGAAVGAYIGNGIIITPTGVTWQAKF